MAVKNEFPRIERKIECINNVAMHIIIYHDGKFSVSGSGKTLDSAILDLTETAIKHGKIIG